MRRALLLIFSVITLIIPQSLRAAANKLEAAGVVTDAKTKEPVSGAIVNLDNGVLWAVTDLDGKYSISVTPGKYSLKIECLGYVSQILTLNVSRTSVEATNEKGVKVPLDFQLQAESLALDEVVVTAQRPAGTMGTSHNIGKEALEHLQMSSMADMSALLPGGKTINPDLTQDNTISLRDGGSSAGNAAFGTAMEVDGVRIGNNAGMEQPAGASTRSVAVENIESIEVITGVPSVEYGDMNSGMVKINTKKGRTPLNISFSVNPRTYQASISKGIGFDKDGGVLNISAEWARATQKLTSPYTSYTRRNIGATYSNTFKKNLRFEAGFNANIGGMNSKDDPDANNGNLSKVNDNTFRGNTSLNWMLNHAWITSLKAEFSVSYADNMSKEHSYKSSPSPQPAIHATEQGYHFAQQLPLIYFADKVVDSKEMDIAAALKYDWTRSFGPVKNRIKAGLQFKSNGNIGMGEYYENMALAPNSYRPRPYKDYPFMNNVSEYIEEQATIPVGKTQLELMAGLRFEQVLIRGMKYDSVNSISPRFNAKWKLTEHYTIRGGWGVSEKLPSFYILYPKQEYLDIQTFAFSAGANSIYTYYTQPFQIEFNPNLKWQRNYNSELAMDFNWDEWKISLVGFYNKTMNPYQIQNRYTPTSLNLLQLPDDYQRTGDLQYKVDNQTGMVYLREGPEDYWTAMDIKATDQTFIKTAYQANGKPIHRAGVELTVDFPQIKVIRTSFRLDAKYSFSSYVNDMLSYYYNNSWKHSSLPNRSYEFVGIYPRGESSSTANGKITHGLDANITSITHIPQAKLVFTIRLEASILKRSMNISEYNGKEYAYAVGSDSVNPVGGSIYNSSHYAAIRPVSYMTLDGQVHPFTDAEAANSDFERLIIRTGNAYAYNQDGYGFYCSANFSITKEIGKHVSLSMFANNFTATRPVVKSMATGVGAVFTPAFYYGLTCRLKF